MSLQLNRSALSKGWGRYYVMHGDRHVATIREDGGCTIYFPSFMPCNLYLESENDLDARVNNLNNFFYWCATRTLTLDRKYIKEILNSIGMHQAVSDRGRAAISLSYHCLSLTDIYWVRGENEKVSFTELNLYQHSLSGAFVDVSLAGKTLTAQNAELLTQKEVAGDLATQGVAPKAWIRRDGCFWLLKDGDERDVKAELLASRIADCFAVDHVRYERDEFDGRAVSRSRIITSLEQSIVPMEHVEIYCANHELETTRFVLRKDAYSYHMMNIIDYLTGNTDRHWGNWGFLVDNRTNRMIRLHPLMDFNKAFTAYDTVTGARCLTMPGQPSQLDAAMVGVKAVGLNRICPIPENLFQDDGTRKMFSQRLNLLESAGRQTTDP